MYMGIQGHKLLRWAYNQLILEGHTEFIVWFKPPSLANVSMAGNPLTSLRCLGKLKECQYCCVMGKCSSSWGNIKLEVMLSGMCAAVPFAYLAYLYQINSPKIRTIFTKLRTDSTCTSDSRYGSYRGKRKKIICVPIVMC